MGTHHIKTISGFYAVLSGCPSTLSAACGTHSMSREIIASFSCFTVCLVCVEVMSHCRSKDTRCVRCAQSRELLTQVTAFREIGIMQRLDHTQGICRLHDFGICTDSIMLVMTKYRCSLREWRHRQPGNCRNQLRLYFNVFAQLAKLLQVCPCPCASP